MSTRAMYTFRNAEGEEHHVYKHHDGDPVWAAEALIKALAYAWQLPRYEPDEFAAAFVAANKGSYIHEELALLRELEALGRKAAFGAPTFDADPTRIAQLMKRLDECREYSVKGYNGGGVRLYQSGKFEDIAPADLEYWYVITQAKGGHLLVTAHSVRLQGDTEWIEDRKGNYRQRKVPKARQGWTIKKLFTAPLKTGSSLMGAAEDWAKEPEIAVA